MASLLGGVRNSTSANSNEIDDLARFAVDQYNKQQNKILKLARVVKAQEQVVAGTLHHLTLEVDDAEDKKIYLAKIWVKPWENFKELQEFNHIPHPDHDVQKDGEKSGYQSVPVHDPVVQDAANHLLKTLQQRSNSLYPYKLQEVVHAKAETVEGSAKYDILVKLKRNDKEEKYKANVHKDNDGKFHVNNMVQDHS
ncbi:cysteine proteinase inhibitor 12 [Tanacetum coccineum]